MQNIYSRVKNKVNSIKDSHKKGFEFETEIAGHCNLNCWGCNHFSPLVQEEYADVRALEKDFRRLAELFDSKIKRLKILGGEPLLHDKIQDILIMARSCFPKGEIQVITNGILLRKMPESFWEVCRRNGIIINITPYPIKCDYHNYVKLVRKHRVRCLLFEDPGNVRIQRKFPLDLNGNQNVEYAFKHCWGSKGCNTLRNGRMYCCSIAPYIDRFNRAFSCDLKLSHNDGIDIYRAESKEEILSFLQKPISFCKYCIVNGRRDNEYIWQVSSRKMEEWV